MKGVSFVYEDEISVSPLTEDEKKWIESLQRVLAKCPKRLEIVTIGDPSVQIVDADGARNSEISDGAADRDGIVLANISGGPKVHGVSG